MNKYLLLVVLSGLLFSCKGKRPSLADSNSKVDIEDFIEFFQPLKLPYPLADSMFKRKDRDSSAINYAICTQFIPDTVFTKHFGGATNPKITALGKVSVPKNETYLFIKASTAAKKILYIAVFDKHGKFSVARPLIVSDNDPLTSDFAVMDTKYTLSIIHQRRTEDGQLLYKKDAFVYNDAGLFTLILTESNQGSPKGVSIINPIDTLSRKHKFTGDYLQDKRNFISVRDGKDPSRFVFFVHFEKDEGECKGELKGVAKFVTANMARYNGNNGDPCAIEFTFGDAGLSMKELEGCGNHRDIKCFFEGYFDKRKEQKPKLSPKPQKKGK
jgi:hypothetical protein